MLYLINYIIIALMLGGLLLTGTLRHFTHILQLNSYYPSRYGAYFKTHLGDIFSLSMLLPLAAYAFAFWRHSMIPAFIAYVLIFLLLDMARPRRTEKKPLVFTARVKRLFVTEGVICALLFVAAFFLSKFALIFFFAIELICPLIVLLANAINSPREKQINRSFEAAARAKIAKMDSLRVIGVTGSFGKTSMKSFVTDLLGAHYNTLMTPGSFNTTMGVVRTINEKLSPLTEVFVCEMGAKNIGDVKEICDLVHPEMGIITAIGEMHLDTFGNVENVLKAKFELADAVGEGVMFLNYDNEYIRSAKIKGKAVTYGTTRGCDFCAKNISQNARGSEFEIEHKGASYTFRTRLLGAHNVLNLTGAVAVATHFGLTMNEIAIAMRRIESVPHRLEVKKSGDITIIDDAYNSNPQGSAAALDVLHGFEGCRIIITPGMVELGSREYELNRALGEKAAQCADYAIFVGEKSARALCDGARAAGIDEKKMFIARDIHNAFDIMRKIDAENKVVLLENDLPDNYL